MVVIQSLSTRFIKPNFCGDIQASFPSSSLSILETRRKSFYLYLHHFAIPYWESCLFVFPNKSTRILNQTISNSLHKFKRLQYKFHLNQQNILCLKKISFKSVPQMIFPSKVNYDSESETTRRVNLCLFKKI